MRKFLALLPLAAATMVIARADSWSGGLLDASCFDKQHQQSKDMQAAIGACGATGQTTMFALHASGKVYKFDSGGNAKAMTAINSRADRSAPGAAHAKEVMAKVDGTESGGTIKVDTIEVQ